MHKNKATAEELADYIMIFTKPFCFFDYEKINKAMGDKIRADALQFINSINAGEGI